MAASEFRRKSFAFVLVLGTAVTLLVVLPLAERMILERLADAFAVVVGAEGTVRSADGTSPGMMTETSVTLLITTLKVFKVVVWMALVIAVVRFFSYLIFSTAVRGGAGEGATLLRTVVSVTIYVVAFFVIFQSIFSTVELAPLFTGSTILGIVVGLALQDTLGNLFAGIALQADQSFQVGDIVSLQSREIAGVVESVSWRGVKIRTFQSKLVVVSHAVLGKEMIEVAPRGNLSARIVRFATEYTESPARVIKAVRGALRHADNVSQKNRPLVRIKNLGDGGIEWEIKYWLDDYSEFNDTDALVRQRIWYAFNRESLQFSQPTQTIHLEPRPAGKTPKEVADAAAEMLRAVPIFAPLSDEELDKLVAASATRVYAPGEAIVRQGREGNSMFVIVRGAVNVQVPAENGTARTINILKDADFFGEMSLLTGEPRTATVVAAEETEVLQIRKTALKPLFENNPSLMKAICEIVDERRELLRVKDEHDGHATQGDRSVLTSIKRFFGMG